MQVISLMLFKFERTQKSEYDEANRNLADLILFVENKNHLSEIQ